MDIEYLLWLQGMRETLSEPVLDMLEVAGSSKVMVLAVLIPCIVYWCLNRSYATLALFAYGASSLCNQLIKNTVCCYRPWIRDARVVPARGAIEGATGYSFPSGHTQSTASMLLGIGWGQRHKRLWPLVLGLFFTVVVALSRNFLGVHSPQDVIVGFVEGCAFVLVAERLLAWIEEREGRDLRVLVTGLVICAVYLAYTTIKPYPHDYNDGVLLVDPAEMLQDCYDVAGAYLGILLGWFVERRYVGFSTDGLTPVQAVVRVVVGLALVLVAYATIGQLLRMAFGRYWGHMLRYAVSLFTAVAGAPKLFMLIENRKS